MYEHDGLICASESMQELEVRECRYVGDRIFLIDFSTGETRLFDATCLFGMPAFEPLEDPAKLEAFKVEDGILTWMDGKIDIAPEGLYARSFEYGTAA